MINDNENDAENEKQITQIREKQTQVKTWTGGKYKMCLSIMMVICIKQYLSTFEAPFMKKLSKTEAELKANVACKKGVHFIN